MTVQIQEKRAQEKRTQNHSQRDNTCVSEAVASVQSVQQLVERVARQTPDAVALVQGQFSLSYSQLNQRANQIAHCLMAQGVGVESIVAVCMHRSVDLFVSLLGILKAGGAYLPIDPSAPDERLFYMLEVADPVVIVSEHSLENRLQKSEKKVLCIESSEIDAYPENDPNVPISSDNLSYVIFTSGSTGRPKGVLLEHKGLLNLSQVLQRAFAMSGRSRVLQFSSIGFDAATFEWVMALTNGASLVIISDEIARSPQVLADTCQRAAITHMVLPPAVLPMLDHYRESHFTTLEYLIVAGEAYTLDLAKRWAHGRTFVNAYGPTEATICATMKPYNDEPVLSIGSALDDCFCLVLNEQGQVPEMGETGELYIGGIGLARGYLGQPELTRERFIFMPEYSNERLYRTGDIVKTIGTSGV
jgi:amino acid adenylation domain-containing protein